MDSILNLNRLTTQDTMSAAIALLYSLKGIPAYTILSELPYILDYKNFIKFIKYYEGQTIKIPTFEEINQMFKILTLYQKARIDKLPWDKALEAAGFTPDESLSCRNKLSAFELMIKSQEFGGRIYE